MEKDGALDKNKIKTDAKPKADVEPETKEKLKDIVSLWDEQAAKKKLLTKQTAELLAKTRKKIESLEKEEIKQLLNKKWIDPIVSAIEAMPDTVIRSFADSIKALDEKYAVTYNDIETELASSQAELASLIDQLTGDDFAIEGLKYIFPIK